MGYFEMEFVGFIAVVRIRRFVVIYYVTELRMKVKVVFIIIIVYTYSSCEAQMQIFFKFFHNFLIIISFKSNIGI